MKDLISILDLNKEEMEKLFSIASLEDGLFKKYNHALDGKILASLFFQPSTRTQFSLQSAFVRLGGSFIGSNNINETRSGAPYYENIEELGKIISNYCDIIVFRTINAWQTDLLKQGATVPLISAGSGNVEHPTQALTDLFTIKKCMGNLSGNKIFIIGTPRQRTINSFINAMAQWNNNEFYILCQQGIYVDNTIIDKSINNMIHYFDSWESFYASDVSKDISIIYIDKIFPETQRKEDFVIDKNLFTKFFHQSVKILHPLPRTHELCNFVDELPGAVYYKQAKYGLYVRAALYLYMLSPDFI